MLRREIPDTCLVLEPKSIRTSKLFYALAYIFDKEKLYYVDSAVMAGLKNHKDTAFNGSLKSNVS